MDVMDMWRLIYQDELPTDIEPMRKLLQSYSNIPSDKIDCHLYLIRNKTWATSRTPCIGRWRFLYTLPSTDPRYCQALHRLKSLFSRDLLLDLGCGLGQALRQFLHDGAPATRLLGTDVNLALIDAGLDLFCDRGAEEEGGFASGVFYPSSSERRAPSGIAGRFVVADFLDDCDAGMKVLAGRATIVHASNFWHMFSWQQQIDIAVRLVTMLKPGTTNAMIYGRQIGKLMAESPTSTTNTTPTTTSLSSGSTFYNDANLQDPLSPVSTSPSASSSSSSTFDSEVAPFSDTSSLASSVSFTFPSESDMQCAFLHNRETFQLMWDIVGERTLTGWTVEMEFVSKTVNRVPGFGDDSYVVYYGIYQTR